METAKQELVKLDPPKNGGSGTTVKFEDKFFVLTGTETTELFIIWWKDYIDKIRDKKGLTHENKMEILKRIVTDSAKTTLDEAIEQSGRDISRHEWRWKIAKNKMKELMEEGLTDEQIHNGKGAYRLKNFCHGKKCELRSNPTGTQPLFTQATDDNDTMKEYQELVFGEIHYRFAEMICGADRYGRQSFVQAKRQMRDMKVLLETGVKKYSNRKKDFNSYLPYLLWDAGNDEGNRPRQFNDKELVKIMEGNLSEAYQTALDDQSHSVWKHTFQETIDLLVTSEDRIKREAEQARNVKLLMGKNNIGPAKGNGGGDKKKRKRNRFGNNEDG